MPFFDFSQPAGRAVIRRIVIDRKNVFETGTPAERQFPYSWANRLHVVTREAFIHVPLIERHSVVDATLPLESHPFQVPGGLLGKPLAFIHS